MSRTLIYSDLQITVETNGYGAIVITAELTDRRSKESYLCSERYYYYYIAEAVEQFAEEHGLDLWDSIENMRQELGEIVDVCPNEETEDAD